MILLRTLNKVWKYSEQGKTVLDLEQLVLEEVFHELVDFVDVGKEEFAFEGEKGVLK